MYGETVFRVKGAVSEDLWNPSLETSHEGEWALQKSQALSEGAYENTLI